MKVAAPARLYRRLLPRLPILVALVFGLYSLALVTYSVDSWLRMRHDANEFLVADNARRAEALGDRVTEIAKDSAQHANLNEVRTYLVNRDLGMSPRYGLDASLQSIEEAFKQHTRHTWSTSASRIAFFGTGGNRLADTEPLQPVLPTTGASIPVARLQLDVDRGLLISLDPVIYKDKNEGWVVTTTTAAILYRNLISSSGTGPYRELLVSADGRELPGGGNARPIDPSLLQRFARAAPNTVQSIADLGADRIDAELADTLMISTPVPGLPLKLVTLLATERAHGHLASPGVLVAAALLPVLLMLGAVKLDRLRLAADRMQAEMRATEQERQWAEQRNLELGAEIRRREVLQSALKASEERWELAIRGANDGIWDWNPQTGDVHFSDRWKTMLGYSPDEIRSDVQEWISRIHPDDLARTLAEMQRHQNGETEFYQCEHRLRCKDGSYKWILDRGQALFDAAGKPTRMAGSHTDVTERYLADARVRDRNAQLDAIFALSPDGFVSFDGRRCVKFVSPAFTGLTGLHPDAVIGLDERGFSARLAAACVPEARFAGMAALRSMKRVGAGGTATGVVSERRQQIEMAGAAHRVLEVGLRESDTETISQILYFRDITHETEVDRLKSEFLSTAAHELRTPMASIFGFAELLMNREFDAEQRLDFVTTIYRQTSLMVAIINELLDLARIEARRGKDFTLTSVVVSSLLDEVVSGFKTPEDRPPPLQRGGDELLSVRADRNKLIQAVSNVLSNAYKYSSAGSSVEINVLTSGGSRDVLPRVGIRIIDHGIGMTPEQLARVCERFYRADASGKIPGTGLGMAIVKEIVELHGGELELESKMGAGTAVTIWLPAARSPATSQTDEVGA